MRAEIYHVQPQPQQQRGQEQPCDGIGDVGLYQDLPPDALFGVLVLPEHEFALKQECAEYAYHESHQIRDLRTGMEHIVAEVVYNIVQYCIERPHHSEFHELPQGGELFILDFHVIALSEY